MSLADGFLTFILFVYDIILNKCFLMNWGACGYSKMVYQSLKSLWKACLMLVKL